MDFPVTRFGSFLLFVLLVHASGPSWAQQCRVIDPELQGSYAGPCVNGLAEGLGSAVGAARYRGEFKAGLKHGKGEKLWPSGDVYEGEFANDRKHGTGTYTWGRGPWAGERYEGGYRDDMRDGVGTYRWNTGDVYAGTWEKDRITGAATPMMLAHAKFEQEARAAVAKEGQKVCREMPIGIAESDWIRGVVVGVSPQGVGVRIDDPGRQPHVVGNTETRAGEVVWDVPSAWIPCF
jgi:hypothetical protein